MSEKNSRADQARINGAKSKGPKTPLGKAISSQNAVKHGHYCTHPVVLSCESVDEYNAILNELMDKFQPADEAEIRLVHQLADLDWNYQRLISAQTVFFGRLLKLADPLVHNFSAESADPYEVLSVSEEASLGFTKYLIFLDRRIANTLTNRARLLRMLKSYKRDFKANVVHPAPSVYVPVPVEESGPEGAKSNMPPRLEIRSEFLIDPITYPYFPAPETNPHSPLIPPLPKAA